MGLYNFPSRLLDVRQEYDEKRITLRKKTFHMGLGLLLGNNRPILSIDDGIELHTVPES